MGLSLNLRRVALALVLGTALFWGWRSTVQEKSALFWDNVARRALALREYDQAFLASLEAALAHDTPLRRRWLQHLSRPTLLETFRGHAHETRARFSAAGKVVLGAGDYTDLATSPDGNWKVMANPYGLAEIWDTRTFKLLGVLRGTDAHNPHVGSANISTDGHFVLTGDAGSQVRLWRRETLRQEGRTLNLGASGATVRFLPDGKNFLAYAFGDGWQVFRTETLQPASAPAGRWTRLLGSDPHRRFVLASSGDRDNAAHLYTLDGVPVGESLRDSEYLFPGDINPDGTQILTNSSGVARLWQATHTPLELGRPLPFSHSGTSRRSLWSPDGRLFTATDEGSLFAWKPGDPPKKQPLFQQSGLTAMALSNDGRQIHGTSNGYLLTWDSSSGQRVGNAEPIPGRVHAMAPDHSLALVTDSMNDAARIWNRNARLLGPALNDGGEIRGAIFSPNGKLVLLLDYNQQGRLWDTETGRRVGGLLRFRHWVRTLAFSPDSRTVLAFNGDVAYRYQVGPETKLLAVRLTPSPVDAVRFPTDCHDCFEALISPAPGRYRIERLTWTLDDVTPMAGDLSALRHDWQIRLALRAKTRGDFEPLR